MAIQELTIQAIKIGGGGLVAEVGIKTERGLMGMSVALKFDNEPELSAAVTAIEDQIERAVVHNLGIGTPDEKEMETAGAEKKH